MIGWFYIITDGASHVFIITFSVVPSLTSVSTQLLWRDVFSNIIIWNIIYIIWFFSWCVFCVLASVIRPSLKFEKLFDYYYVTCFFKKNSFCNKHWKTGNPQSYSMWHCICCLLWTQDNLWLFQCWITRRVLSELVVYNNLCQQPVTACCCLQCIRCVVISTAVEKSPPDICVCEKQKMARMENQYRHADRPHNRICLSFLTLLLFMVSLCFSEEEKK